MTKKFLSLLLALLLLVPTLASCNGGGSGDGDGTKDVQTGDTDSAAVTDGEGEDTAEETLSLEELYPDPFADEITPDFYLTENGVSDYVIVCGENADSLETKAAAELQSYIKQISGAELPIVSDAEAPAEHEIVVGKTNRETEGQFDRTAISEDGFMLDIADGRVYIVGGASLGTLYGAYTFLEEHLGCRFYTYDFERVPQNESIGLVVCEDTQTPVIATRHSYWYDVNCNGTIRDKQKMNIDYYRRANGIHTIPSLAGTGDGLSSDPCLLADSVYETVLASVRSLLEARPDAQYISVSQSDGGICECTDCRASYEIHGESGHYLRFVNRIAEEIADEYPNVLVHTFAYGSTTTPPKDDTVAADNVLVQLCTTGSCHAHSLKDCPENRNFLKILDGWGKICKNLSIWDYQTNFSCFNSMQPYFSTYFENAKIFADNHAVYYFAQGDNFCSSGEFSGLKGYLVARLLWDPYMDRETYDTYMNEFLCDYYGPGWREIRAFIDQAEKDCTGHQTLLYTNAADPLPVDITYIDAIIDEMGLPEYTIDDLRNMMDIDWDAYYEASGYEELYPNRSLKMGYEAFENALALAENDEQRTHIERSTIQLDTQKVFFMDGSFQPKLYFLKQLFYRLVSVCIANGTLDDVESYTLIYQFDGWILDSLYRTSTREEIAEHNRALAKKMLDYGVYWMGEAADLRSIPYEEFNFEKGMPVECHRGSTGGHISWLPEHN